MKKHILILMASCSMALAQDKINLELPEPQPVNKATLQLDNQTAATLLTTLQSQFFNLPEGKTLDNILRLSAYRRPDGSAVLVIDFSRVVTPEE